MINTVSCTPDEAKELIKSLRSLKLSFMLWGTTGVGKSETVRQLAAELDAELRDIRLCQKQPTDIGGLPALDHASQQTVFYPPAFLAPRADEKAVILFFDEISLAPDDTKGAVLGILEERRQGGIEIPDNWIIVAAEFMLLAEEVKNMKSVDELLEIQRKTPSKIGAFLPDTINGLYALSFAIATRASSDTAVELLELVNRFDEQTSERFAALPMRDLQTMAGSLLLDKIWKAGWKVENSKAFWRYNEKREAAANGKQTGDSESLTVASASTITAVAVA